jgi:hypothetical protein
MTQTFTEAIHNQSSRELWEVLYGKPLVKTNIKVIIETKLEPIEEIDKLMQEVPGFGSKE